MDSLEIVDFKSFRGTHKIEKLPQFVAVIGTNGSGKSNVADAISFVLGAAGRELRVNRLDELVYGATTKRKQTSTCRVTMTIRDPTSRQGLRSFTRTVVQRSGSEYRADNTVVTPSVYQTSLEVLNIFGRTRNFMIDQGQVERLALMKPLEITALFDRLSGSSDLRSEYQPAKELKDQTEARLGRTMRGLRDASETMATARKTKEHAENCALKREEHTQKRIKLFVAQLFEVEHKRTLDNERYAAIEAERATHINEKVSTKQADTATHRTQRAAYNLQKTLDKRLTDAKADVLKQKEFYTNKQTELKHDEKRLATAQKALDARQKKIAEHAKEDDELKTKLNDAQKRLSDIIAEQQEHSQRENLQLDETQLAEYRRLKDVAMQQNIAGYDKLDNLRQEHQTDQDMIAHEKHKVSELNDRITREQGLLERTKKNVEQLETERDRMLANREEKEREASDVASQMTHVPEEEARLNKEISARTATLVEANAIKAESKLEYNRRTALLQLLTMMPDKVHGRLGELYRPTHNRFNVAVSKAIGRKSQNAIITDTAETAQKCFEYLKMQKLKETVWPLDTLKPHPVNENLRELRDTGVHLVYDVIELVPSVSADVKMALQYAANNQLIAETPEVAADLAYGRNGRGRHRAVALNGTLVETKGAILGGAADQRANASQWNEHELRRLRNEIDERREELRRLTRTRQEHEMRAGSINSEIQIVSSRLKAIEINLNKERTRITSLEHEMEHLTSDSGNSKCLIDDKRASMEERQPSIEAARAQCSQVEDAVFADFCAALNIRDIRQYEDRELRAHTEMQGKQNELEVEIARLEDDIKFAKSTAYGGSALRAQERKVDDQKSALEATKIDVQEHASQLKELEAAAKTIEAELQAQKTRVCDAEEAQVVARAAARKAVRDLNELERRAAAQKSAVRTREFERYQLLRDAKLQIVAVPLRRGTLSQLVAMDVGDSSEAATPSEATNSQSVLSSAEELEVDFHKLSNAEKQQLRDSRSAQTFIKKLEEEVQRNEAQLQKIRMPDANWERQVEDARIHKKSVNDNCTTATDEHRVARNAYEEVHNRRRDRFLQFYNTVRDEIDSVYKGITNAPGAHAVIDNVSEANEPFNSDTNFTVVPPGKRSMKLEYLSGGEKTMAALALLFAIHAGNPSPFFVLDEADAALDSTNLRLVLDYISKRSQRDVQVIMISHHVEAHAHADVGIGISVDELAQPCAASEIYRSIDMTATFGRLAVEPLATREFEEEMTQTQAPVAS